MKYNEKSRARGTKPVYAASYDEKLDEAYENIVSRPKFEYDVKNDGLYKQYKDDYIQNGRMAMRDTVGQASALTGGYASSYAEGVGQEKYGEYMQKLGAIVPELYSLAHSRYADEGEALKDDYDMLASARDREYEEYRDELSDYNSAEKFAYEKEKEERERADAEAERSYERSRTEAEARAKYGDFSGYAALYGDSAAEQMKNYWIASNPAAAYGMGLISTERYYALTGAAPSQGTSASSSSRASSSYYPSTAPDGRDAKVVQRELRNKGYNIAVDGAWGPKSQKAWEKAMGSGSSGSASGSGSGGYVYI